MTESKPLDLEKLKKLLPEDFREIADYIISNLDLEEFSEDDKVCDILLSAWLELYNRLLSLAEQVEQMNVNIGLEKDYNKKLAEENEGLKKQQRWNSKASFRPICKGCGQNFFANKEDEYCYHCLESRLKARDVFLKEIKWAVNFDYNIIPLESRLDMILTAIRNMKDKDEKD